MFQRAEKSTNQKFSSWMTQAVSEVKTAPGRD